MTHRVTLIPGDGIGPEIMEAARRCIDNSASINGIRGCRCDGEIRRRCRITFWIPSAETRWPSGLITTPIGTGFQTSTQLCATP